ncbi:hypothetical protein B0H21DRAFT_824474 [Amylocystis lapponica]|nr:hypothetical protein B0H21DRAFT_824474 [Amylocystis lapponica]
MQRVAFSAHHASPPPPDPFSARARDKRPRLSSPDDDPQRPVSPSPTPSSLRGRSAARTFQDPFSGSDAASSSRSISPVVHRSIVTGSGSSHLLPPPSTFSQKIAGRPAHTLSKSASDLLTATKDDIIRVKNAIEAHEQGFDNVDRRLIQLETACGDLIDHNEALATQNEELRQMVQDYIGRIARLEDTVEDMRENAPVPHNDQQPQPTVTGEQAAPKRNNRLQLVVRTTLHNLIGTDHKSVPPPPLHKGCFWTAGSEHERSLRPSWDSWYENKVGWAREVAEKIRVDGTRWHSALSQAELQAVAAADLDAAIQSAWDTLRTKYKVSQKTEEEREEKKRRTRHEQRKNKKAKERAAFRHLVPELAGSDHDYLVQARYQSSDESDSPTGGGPIDSETDTEGGQNVPQGARQQPWKSRPPKYRAENVEVLVVKLDRHVFASRQAKLSAGATQGNTYHARVRGSPVDKPLPKRAKNGILIPRSQVSAVWLAAQNDGDVAGLMAEAEDISAPGSVVGDGEPLVQAEDEWDENIDPALRYA